MEHLLRKLRNKRERPNTKTPPDSADFPEGIKVWVDPGSKAIIDIVFVHGLTGDRERTWTPESSNTPWPKAYLPQAISDARIMTFGYDAYIVRASVASANTLRHHAEDFLNCLVSKRGMCSGRPIVLVAHSLGGLVCKDALVLSMNPPESHLRDLYQSTRAIAFMGTPHEGSTFADWAKMPASILGCMKSTNQKLLEVLRTNSEILDRLQDDFLHLIRRAALNAASAIDVTCFCEALPMPGAGIIVSSASAKLPGYSLITVHENHRNMAKFGSRDSPGYEKFLGEMERWTSKLREQIILDVKNRSRGLLQSLAFPSMDERQAEIPSPMAGTCSWVHASSVYRSWDGRCKPPDGKSAHWLLWIKGKPGAGKSTIMKEILEHRAASPGTLRLSFFFNARGSNLEKSQIGLYRSLNYQILGQSNPSDDHFLWFQSEYKERTFKHGSEWTWSLSELCHRLHEALLKGNWEAIEVFIDALDECSDPNLRELVHQFYETAETVENKGSNMRICWSSRHDPHISVKKCLEMVVEQENKSDIQAYVSKRLILPQTQRDLGLEAEIVRRSSGVFLWAVLVIRNFQKAIDQGLQLSTILEDLPTELEDLFDDIFTRTKTIAERNLMLHLTQWVLYAGQRLTCHEMFIALHFAGGIPNGLCPKNAVDLNTVSRNFNEQQFARYVTHVSGGLFEVSFHDHRVHLIHESVRQYFKGYKAPRTFQLQSSRELGMVAERAIVRACRAYLQISDLFEPSRPVGQELVNVLAQYLGRRFRVARISPPNTFAWYVLLHYGRLVVAEDSVGQTQLCSHRDDRELARDAAISWIVHCAAGMVGELKPHSDVPWNLPLENLLHIPWMFGISGEELSQIRACLQMLELANKFLFSKFKIVDSMQGPQEGEATTVHEVMFGFPNPPRQEQVRNYETIEHIGVRSEVSDLDERTFWHLFTATLTTTAFAKHELASYLQMSHKAQDMRNQPSLFDWELSEPRITDFEKAPIGFQGLKLVITRISRAEDNSGIQRHWEGDIPDVLSRSHYRQL